MLKLLIRSYMFILRQIKKYHKKIIFINLKSQYCLHSTVKLWPETFLYGGGKIKVGEGTYFGKNTFIASYPENAIIEIGKRCMISHNVHIRTSGYDENTLNREVREIKYGNIKIGDCVWIGVNVYIKGGVSIGNNVAIGANSVVTKSFPDDVVIAGAPAKIIKQLDKGKTIDSEIVNT